MLLGLIIRLTKVFLNIHCGKGMDATLKLHLTTVVFISAKMSLVFSNTFHCRRELVQKRVFIQFVQVKGEIDLLLLTLGINESSLAPRSLVALLRSQGHSLFDGRFQLPTLLLLKRFAHLFILLNFCYYFSVKINRTNL